MSMRSRPIERAIRRIEDDLHRVLADVDVGRRNAGLSFDSIGAACRVAGSTAARTTSGQTVDPDLRLLAAMAATVGLELRIRTYPAGDPLRDAGQRRLLERLRLRLAPGMRWQTEVPLPIEGDLRAWDAMIVGPDWRMAVEAETALSDLQAIERRVALKQRDGAVERVLVLVADTRWNRAILASSHPVFAGFDRDARRNLRDLGRGVDPGSSALILL